MNGPDPTVSDTHTDGRSDIPHSWHPHVTWLSESLLALDNKYTSAHRISWINMYFVWIKPNIANDRACVVQHTRQRATSNGVERFVFTHRPGIRERIPPSMWNGFMLINLFRRQWKWNRLYGTRTWSMLNTKKRDTVTKWEKVRSVLGSVGCRCSAISAIARNAI